MFPYGDPSPFPEKRQTLENNVRNGMVRVIGNQQRFIQIIRKTSQYISCSVHI